MTRRQLLSTSLLPLAAFRAAAQNAPPMRIKKVETIHWPGGGSSAPFLPHWIWLRLTTEDGLTAVGETYPYGEPEAAVMHTVIARMLKNRDARDIDRIWADLYHDFDYRVAGGAEMRALSALDLALWDLLGKSLNTPVYRLLGGRSNGRIRVYNTQRTGYKNDFMNKPVEIMRDLIANYGVRGIKVWPFDGAGRRNKGQFVTQGDLDEGLAPVRKLRDEFGSSIEIAIEFHSYWSVTAGARIARALEPYNPLWLEDMMMPGNFGQYRQLAETTSIPLMAGERMAGRMPFLQMLESRAIKFVMFDVCWCGGVSEARKIAQMAEAYQLPVAPHTAGGPLLFYATTHLTTALTNVWIQESCQRFYEHDWPMILENPIQPQDGSVAAPELPGFGLRIKDEVWKHPAASVRTTEL
jgi:L-alanine-DL-glutamate epimerase-like enolase superfamily enzyme